MKVSIIRCFKQSICFEICSHLLIKLTVYLRPLNQKLGIKKRDQFEDDDEDDEEEEEENNDQKPSTSVQAIGTSHFRNQQKNSSFSNQIKSNYGNNEVGQNKQPENKRFDKNQRLRYLIKIFVLI